MNSGMKFGLLAIGGVVLFAGSFAGFALLSGAPAHEIAGLKMLVHPPAKKASATETPHPELGHAADPVAVAKPDPVSATAGAPVHTAPTAAIAKAPEPRHKEPVEAPKSIMSSDVTAGVLGAFVLPSPFNTAELGLLQAKLNDRLEDAERRLQRVVTRERELDDRGHALDTRAAEISDMKRELDKQIDDLKVREADLAKRGGSKPEKAGTEAEREKKSWKEVAKFFQEGDLEDLSQRLVTFEPTEAAEILRELDPERAAELLNSIPVDQYKDFVDAYRASTP